MFVEKAKAYFLGKDGHKKLNCGQSVISTFKDEFRLSDEIVRQFEDFGGGKAPQGYCGTFYAAKVILEKDYPDKLKECEKEFLDQAGSTKCKDIRALRKLTCLGCVEKAAQCLENVVIAKKGAAGLNMLGPKDARKLLEENGQFKLLDVRSAMEFSREHIKDSINVPVDMIPEKIDDLARSRENYIVLCSIGSRSQRAASMLAEAGISGIKVMEGGISRWKKEGLPLIKGKGGLSLERQVRMIAGILVLGGILMSWLTHWAFIFISVFVSSGLIYAGITDSCMMGTLLMKLPYNNKLYKADPQGGSCSI